MNRDNYLEINLGYDDNDYVQRKFSIRKAGNDKIKYFILFLLSSIFVYLLIYLIGILPKTGYLIFFYPSLLLFGMLVFFYYKFYIFVLKILGINSIIKKIMYAMAFSILSNLFIAIVLNVVFMFNQDSLILISGRPAITLAVLITFVLYIMPFFEIKKPDCWLIAFVIKSLAVSAVLVYFFGKDLPSLLFGISFLAVSISITVIFIIKKIKPVIDHKQLLLYFLVSFIFGIALYLACYEAKKLVFNLAYLFVFFSMDLVLFLLLYFAQSKFLRGKNEKNH